MGKANLGNKLDVARTDECSFSPSMALSPCHPLAYAASVQFEVFTDKEKKNGAFDSPAAEREEWTEGDKAIADYEVDIR